MRATGISPPVWLSPPRGIPDHGGMTVRPPPGFPLPELVRVANRVLTEEAEALHAAMEQFGSAPQPGSPWAQDDKAVSDRADPEAHGRARGLLYARHQAALTYVNAWDHLISLARILGGDGAMPLFSHASVSRVVCEAAVRFAWLMDPDVSSEERIARGAVALYISADERFKGVRRLPAGYPNQRTYQQMLDASTQERDAIEALITGAGLTFGYDKTGKRKSRLELASANVSVPLQINVSELMAKLLSDSPSWYNIGSSVAHSHYWGLRDVNDSRPGQSLSLTPNVMNVGAAAESTISASALIVDRCGKMNGHDPSTHVQRAMERREEVDALMRRATTSAWARIPTETPHRGPDRP